MEADEHASERPELGPVRVMALDWGQRRLGVAVSDELGIAAHGLPTIVRTTTHQDIDALIGLIRERQIETVVIGDPVNMDGTASGSSKKARRFAFHLARHAGVQVEMWDERLSSWEAARMLGPRARDAGEVDRMAAILVLEGYLAAKAP